MKTRVVLISVLLGACASTSGAKPGSPQVWVRNDGARNIQVEGVPEVWIPAEDAPSTGIDTGTDVLVPGSGAGDLPVDPKVSWGARERVTQGAAPEP